MNLGVMDGSSELARFHLRHFFEWLLHFNDDHDFSYLCWFSLYSTNYERIKSYCVASSIHIFYMGIVSAIILVLGREAHGSCKAVTILQCTVQTP